MCVQFRIISRHIRALVLTATRSSDRLRGNISKHCAGKGYRQISHASQRSASRFLSQPIQLRSLSGSVNQTRFGALALLNLPNKPRRYCITTTTVPPSPSWMRSFPLKPEGVSATYLSMGELPMSHLMEGADLKLTPHHESRLRQVD